MGIDLGGIFDDILKDIKSTVTEAQEQVDKNFDNLDKSVAKRGKQTADIIRSVNSKVQKELSKINPVSKSNGTGNNIPFNYKKETKAVGDYLDKSSKMIEKNVNKYVTDISDIYDKAQEEIQKLSTSTNSEIAIDLSFKFNADKAEKDFEKQYKQLSEKKRKTIETVDKKDALKAKYYAMTLQNESMKKLDSTGKVNSSSKMNEKILHLETNIALSQSIIDKIDRELSEVGLGNLATNVQEDADKINQIIDNIGKHYEKMLNMNFIKKEFMSNIDELVALWDKVNNYIVSDINGDKNLPDLSNVLDDVKALNNVVKNTVKIANGLSDEFKNASKYIDDSGKAISRLSKKINALNNGESKSVKASAGQSTENAQAEFIGYYANQMRVGNIVNNKNDKAFEYIQELISANKEYAAIFNEVLNAPINNTNNQVDTSYALDNMQKYIEKSNETFGAKKATNVDELYDMYRNMRVYQKTIEDYPMTEAAEEARRFQEEIVTLNPQLERFLGNCERLTSKKFKEVFSNSFEFTSNSPIIEEDDFVLVAKSEEKLSHIVELYEELNQLDGRSKRAKTIKTELEEFYKAYPTVEKYRDIMYELRKDADGNFIGNIQNAEHTYSQIASAIQSCIEESEDMHESVRKTADAAEKLYTIVNKTKFKNMFRAKFSQTVDLEDGETIDQWMDTYIESMIEDKIARKNGKVYEIPVPIKMIPEKDHSSFEFASIDTNKFPGYRTSDVTPKVDSKPIEETARIIEHLADSTKETIQVEEILGDTISKNISSYKELNKLLDYGSKPDFVKDFPSESEGLFKVLKDNTDSNTILDILSNDADVLKTKFDTLKSSVQTLKQYSDVKNISWDDIPLEMMNIEQRLKEIKPLMDENKEATLEYYGIQIKLWKLLDKYAETYGYSAKTYDKDVYVNQSDWIKSLLRSMLDNGNILSYRESEDEVFRIFDNVWDAIYERNEIIKSKWNMKKKENVQNPGNFVSLESIAAINNNWNNENGEWALSAFEKDKNELNEILTLIDIIKNRKNEIYGELHQAEKNLGEVIEENNKKRLKLSSPAFKNASWKGLKPIVSEQPADTSIPMIEQVADTTISSTSSDLLTNSIEQQIEAEKESAKVFEVSEKKKQNNIKNTNDIVVKAKDEIEALLQKKVDEINNTTGKENAKYSINRDNQDNIKSATITYVNKELGQTVSETYAWHEANEEVEDDFTGLVYMGSRLTQDAIGAEERKQKVLEKTEDFLNRQKNLLLDIQQLYDKRVNPNALKGINDKGSLTTLRDKQGVIQETIDSYLRNPSSFTHKNKTSLIDDIKAFERIRKSLTDKEYGATDLSPKELSINKNIRTQDYNAFIETLKGAGKYTDELRSKVEATRDSITNMTSGTEIKNVADNLKAYRSEFRTLKETQSNYADDLKIIKELETETSKLNDLQRRQEFSKGNQDFTSQIDAQFDITTDKANKAMSAMERIRDMANEQKISNEQLRDAEEAYNKAQDGSDMSRAKYQDAKATQERVNAEKTEAEVLDNLKTKLNELEKEYSKFISMAKGDKTFSFQASFDKISALRKELGVLSEDAVINGGIDQSKIENMLTESSAKISGIVNTDGLKVLDEFNTKIQTLEDKLISTGNIGEESAKKIEQLKLQLADIVNNKNLNTPEGIQGFITNILNFGAGLKSELAEIEKMGELEGAVSQFANIETSIGEFNQLTNTTLKFKTVLQQVNTLMDEWNRFKNTTQDKKFIDEKQVELLKQLAPLMKQLRKESQGRGTPVIGYEGEVENIESLKNATLKYASSLGFVKQVGKMTQTASDEITGSFRNQEGQTIKLTTAINSATKGMNVANMGFKDTVTIGGAMKSMLGTMGKSLTWFFGGYHLVMKFTSALREGIDVLKDYDSAITTISYTMNMTEQQLDKLGQSAINMAKDLSMSLDDAMSIYQIYANMNTTAQEIAATGTPTAILSNLSGVDASTAADQVQGVIEQFGLLEDAESNVSDVSMHVVDVLDNISSNVAIDYAKGISTITEAVTATGQVAKDAGMTYEELAAISAKVAERTREDGSIIGNAMKTMFTRISKVATMPGYEDEIDNESVSKATQALKEIGIDVYQANGEFNDITDTITQLNNKWDSLTDAQKSYISYQVAATRLAKANCLYVQKCA